MPILNWLTRDEDTKAATKVPYRLLEEVPEHSLGALDTGNMLIQGDNLEALKALLPFYAGRVKCIYIDPPYNTRSAFGHYDDNLQHSQSGWFVGGGCGGGSLFALRSIRLQVRAWNWKTAPSDDGL